MGGGLSKHEDEQEAPVAKKMDETLAAANTNSEAKEEAEKKLPEKKSGCPMHNSDGSYNYSLTALLRGVGIHGPGGNTELPKEEQEKARQAKP
mmetsp:Transcript_5238/g.8611  ORF Transcript_5238/g.8611 Transcript_5238/m.8611 type:complete len:93 (-) Transcript_5238:204-482(-)|eukprot:CAMPEP_0119010452 /NCGR_PEP_ID=MMETSP1176-20130426/5019_1 /TAXON_ID=265551 /ORGANISM="Synedropsis recta cf, Strain CCMP1620" /LENGTH=92 /DNA_ID=CAMNT_0006963107 /DNA_START=152 /DNA_END=430 /DNA_ORIENTATION=-